jgi:hypothetical protein
VIADDDVFAWALSDESCVECFSSPGVVARRSGRDVEMLCEKCGAIWYVDGVFE